MLTLIYKKRWNVETYGAKRVKVSYPKFKNGEATVKDVTVEPNLGKPLELQMLTLTLSPPVASLEATDKKVLQHSWPL